MDFKFIPNSFNYNLALSKFIDNEKFIECQVKYKRKFEKFLCRYIDFGKIHDYIINCNIEIPRLKDEDYNFYHKYSNIGSSYIYVRNNYHVENLTDDEINRVLNEEHLDEKFFFETFKKVIFENGESTYFGPPMDETEVKSKSIIFEFAYNQFDCQSVVHLNDIKKIIAGCFDVLESSINDRLGISVSFLVYNGIPDMFCKNERKFK